MYLTTMPLNPVRRGAQKLLGSPQSMHAAVLSSFPPGLLTSENRVLWRVDQFSQHEVNLVLVSPSEPDLTHIVEQAGWQTGNPWQTRDYSPLLKKLQEGQQWSFRLTANPVFYARKGDWEDTKPVGHLTVKHQEQWLLDRVERLGFQIPDGLEEEKSFAVVERKSLFFRKGGHKVTLTIATFEGILEITDKESFLRSLTAGIGRAKAYGCGLLTIAPAV
ncbi:MAG: type I-E CRISPR-associated protein Cas6/Cse3/CasE [Mycobacteriaceae bacterium]